MHIHNHNHNPFSTEAAHYFFGEHTNNVICEQQRNFHR